MNILEFRGVSKTIKHKAITRDMNMHIRENSFSVIFGAPGSGKSTLLRLITGLDKPDRGEICLRGQVVNRVSSAERNIGYVPQSFALYPHYSVFDNIAYPLKLMGMHKNDYRPIVESAAAQLQITHLLAKRPDQCSGGEKQRVAIARGIVKNTRLFILDDPLTGLDFKLRERLFDDLRQMKDDLGATFIYTTSDPLEALMLAEDIHIFDNGTIIEAGDIETVYHQPQQLRTMALLGYPNTNLLAARLDGTGNGRACQAGAFRFGAALNTPTADSAVTVAVRPQHIAVNPTGSGMVTAEAEITLVEDLGGELHVYLESGGVELETVVQQGSAAPTEGRATIGVYPHDFRLFAGGSGQYIGQGVD